MFLYLFLSRHMGPSFRKFQYHASIGLQWLRSSSFRRFLSLQAQMVELRLLVPLLAPLLSQNGKEEFKKHKQPCWFLQYFIMLTNFCLYNWLLLMLVSVKNQPQLEEGKQLLRSNNSAKFDKLFSTTAPTSEVKMSCFKKETAKCCSWARKAGKQSASKYNTELKKCYMPYNPGLY